MSHARTRWDVQAAVRQARRVSRSYPASVRICWDLDNTLVDSGSLIRDGKRLEEAVVEARPVANMLEFYDLMRSRLPHAEHFILSARSRSMRGDTLAWIHRYGLTSRADAVCFVPYAEAKREVWQQLARGTQLVIVDDLSYDHESDRPSVHHELVAAAERTACVYVGVEQISEISTNSGSMDAAAARIVAALAL
jgi:hypothetical protein